MDVTRNLSVPTGKRIRIRDRVLPAYTKGEEVFNTVTHIVGGAVGIAALVLCVIKAALASDVLGIICGSIFGVSMVTLYTMSCVYHGLRVGTAKKVFQIMDHCTIYFLIAGTYTPILLCSLVKDYPVNAWITFGAVWGLTALSVTLIAIDMTKYKIFGMLAYIGIGWAIIFSIKQVYEVIGPVGFALLLGGGLLYTGGTLFFCAGKRKRYCHSVFHIFVVLGSVAHSACILFFVV